MTERTVAIIAAGKQSQRFLRKSVARTPAEYFNACALIQTLTAIQFIEFNIERPFPILIYIAIGAAVIIAVAAAAVLVLRKRK